MPAVLWGAGIELLGGTCPLTPLENHLRRLAGRQGYDGGFIEHYVVAVLYPDSLTRGVQVVLGVTLLLANLAAYGWVARRLR